MQKSTSCLFQISPQGDVSFFLGPYHYIIKLIPNIKPGFRRKEMTHQNDLLKVSEVRAIATQLFQENHVPDDVIQAARGTVQTMCLEAAAYGLSAADIVRFVFRPVFARRQGCNCPTCKVRSSELEEELLQQWRTQTLRRPTRRESVSQ